MTEPLATSDDVLERLGRALTSEETAKIDALLLDVSSAIRGYTHQTLTSEETTALLVMSNRTIRLPLHPVTDVASVVDQFGNAWPFQWMTGDDRISVATSTWINLFELNIYPWTRVGKLAVTYTHGYETIPDLIVGLACHLALRALGVPSTQSGIMQETITNYSYQIGTAAASGPFGLLASEKELLDSYRRLAGPIVMI